MNDEFENDIAIETDRLCGGFWGVAFMVLVIVAVLAGWVAA